MNWRPGFVHPCPMVCYLVQKRPPSDPILCQLNPVYTRTLDFLCTVPAVLPSTHTNSLQSENHVWCFTTRYAYVVPVVNSEPKFQAAEPALVGSHHSFFRQYEHWRHFPCHEDVSSNHETWGKAMLTTQHNEQDRQCAYNATVRCVRETIVVVGKQWVLHNLSVCICSLRHPACNTHAPYYHLWPAPFYNIFPHFLINGTIFGGEKVTENISDSKKK
jgi:hypothetical protein